MAGGRWRGRGQSVPGQAVGLSWAVWQLQQRAGVAGCALRTDGRKPSCLLIMFLLLPPAQMRGKCRFRCLQVTAGHLVVLPRGDSWSEQPSCPSAHRAGVQRSQEQAVWSPSPSPGSILVEPIRTSFLAGVLRKE